MPAPQKSLFSKLAKTYFTAKGIKLPVQWKDMGAHYSDAFKASERKVAPNPPTTLFHQATLNKNHVGSADDTGKKFEKFIDGICGAICDAIDNWLKMAAIGGAVVNGPVGVVAPGNVIGPPLTPLIMAGAPKDSAQLAKFSSAVAVAVGTQWQAWQTGLAGMLPYPAFAAFPGPIAPPTPNVPIPLIALGSPGEAGLAPGVLKSLMQSNLGDPKAQHATELFDSISQAFSNVFMIFKASTLACNVSGMGPSANPALPAPVVGGTTLPLPGALK